MRQALLPNKREDRRIFLWLGLFLFFGSVIFAFYNANINQEVSIGGKGEGGGGGKKPAKKTIVTAPNLPENELIANDSLDFEGESKNTAPCERVKDGCMLNMGMAKGKDLPGTGWLHFQAPLTGRDYAKEDQLYEKSDDPDQELLGDVDPTCAWNMYYCSQQTNKVNRGDWKNVISSFIKDKGSMSYYVDTDGANSFRVKAMLLWGRFDREKQSTPCFRVNLLIAGDKSPKSIKEELMVGLAAALQHQKESDPYAIAALAGAPQWLIHKRFNNVPQLGAGGNKNAEKCLAFLQNPEGNMKGTGLKYVMEAENEWNNPSMAPKKDSLQMVDERNALKGSIRYQYEDGSFHYKTFYGTLPPTMLFEDWLWGPKDTYPGPKKCAAPKVKEAATTNEACKTACQGEWKHFLLKVKACTCCTAEPDQDSMGSDDMWSKITGALAVTICTPSTRAHTASDWPSATPHFAPKAALD